MEPNFSYLTPGDLDLSFNYQCGPRLTNMAYKQLMQCFKAGLFSFPQFHFQKDAYIYDDCNLEESYSEAEKAAESVQSMRTILDGVPGHLGDTLRSSLLRDLETGFCYMGKSVKIKPAVLLSIFGHIGVTELTVSLTELCFLFPDEKLFETMASKCVNLRKLVIDVEPITSDGWEEAYYWEPLGKLTSLKSLTIVGGKLPTDLSISLKLKTLKFLRIKDENLSSYSLCAVLLRLEFKNVAQVLASSSFTCTDISTRPTSTLTINRLLECAGNEACLQPLCQSLTTLVIEKVPTYTFWQPCSAAFLLLACPNLRNFQTIDSFPYCQALQLLRKRKEGVPKTFNLRQLYVVLDHKEDFQAMIKATPHYEELVVQGISHDDWESPYYSISTSDWLLTLLEAVGEKASVLSVTYKVNYDCGLEEIKNLPSVRQLCLLSRDVHFFEDDIEESDVVHPALKDLRKFIFDGCWKNARSGGAHVLVRFPNLEQLYIQCIHFCSTGSELVEFASQYWKHLRLLHIKFMKHVKWDTDDLMSLLKVCSRLQTLVLPHSALSTLRGEQFVQLNAFAEARGTKIWFAKPYERDFC